MTLIYQLFSQRFDPLETMSIICHWSLETLYHIDFAKDLRAISEQFVSF